MSSFREEPLMRHPFKPFIACAIVLLTTVAVPSFAREMLSGSTGELIDEGAIKFTAYPDSNNERFSCATPPTFTREGNRFDVRIVLEAGAPTQSCPYEVVFDFGRLAAGAYTLSTTYTGSANRNTTYKFRIDESAKSCANDPNITEILARHPTKDTAALTLELADPVKRAALGNPLSVRPLYTSANPPNHDVILKYAPPHNLTPIASSLTASQGFAYAGLNFRLCFATSPPDLVRDMVEYFHAGLNHYFYSADPAEIGFVDNGGAGQGWSRTGQAFRVVVSPGCPIMMWDPAYFPRYRPTFRFYGKPGTGPNSHFFTASRAECHAVLQDAGWQYEGSTFWAEEPVEGTCLPTTRPLYRLFNNRVQQNDSNHRFTTETAIVAEMVAKGWVNEGPAMCVPKP
jgi:hypothetical protein